MNKNNINNSSNDNDNDNNSDNINNNDEIWKKNCYLNYCRWKVFLIY